MKYNELNYIQMGNMHIIFNVDEKVKFRIASQIFGKSAKGTNNQNYHIFLTSHEGMENYLREIVTMLSSSLKTTIHIPKQAEDLKLMAELYLSGCEAHYNLIVEKSGPIFVIPGGAKGLKLRIRYDDSGIEAYVTAMKTSYDGYNIEGSPGAIKTVPMRLMPEMFKDKIISNFKAACPPGILNSFETDEDIWKYIMMEGDWAVKDDQPRVSYTDQMADAIRPLFNSQLGNMMGGSEDENNTNNQ